MKTVLRIVPLALLAVTGNGEPAESLVEARSASSAELTYGERVAQLEEVYRKNPEDTEVLDALVGSYAMGSRYEEAIGAILDFLQSEPAEARWRFRLAQLHYWNGNAEAALGELEVISGSLDTEQTRFRCHVLTSDGQAAEAAKCYRTLIAAGDPGETAKYELGHARNLAWSGAPRRAIDSYLRYLQKHGSDRDAHIELVRQFMYRGNYGEAKRRLDAILVLNPKDVEALALRSELLHWLGRRGFRAKKDAERALDLAPDDLRAKIAYVYALHDLGQRRDAVEEFDAIHRRLTLQGVDPTASYAPGYRYLAKNLQRFSISDSVIPVSIYNDSDSIHALSVALEAGIPIQRDHKIQLRVTERRSSAPQGSPFTLGREKSGLRQFEMGGTVLARPGMKVFGMGGAADRPLDGGLRPIFHVGLTGSPSDRWEIEFDAGREFFALTPRAMDLDISNYFMGSRVRHHFSARHSLGVSSQRRFWSDDNSSTTVQADYQRILRYSNTFLIDAGARSRMETFDRDTQLEAGFFTPDLMWRHEATVGLNGSLGRRLSYDLRGAAGTQRLKRGTSFRPSYEFFSSVGVGLSGPLRMTANYVRRNYSLVQGNGWYQGFYFGLQVTQ